MVSPLKTKINLTYLRFSSYRAVNAVNFRYNQSVNVAQGNNRVSTKIRTKHVNALFGQNGLNLVVHTITTRL
jgi:hypothetical protein